MGWYLCFRICYGGSGKVEAEYKVYGLGRFLNAMISTARSGKTGKLPKLCRELTIAVRMHTCISIMVCTAICNAFTISDDGCFELFNVGNR